MPSTPTYGFRYPALSDDPDVPGDMENLAEDLETEITRVDSDHTTDIARLDDLLTGYAAPTQVGSGTLPVGGDGVAIMSVSITDPGFDYRIMASGSCGWGVIAGSVAGALFECSITIDSTDYDTGVLAKGFVRSHSVSANFSQPTCIVPLKQSGSQTGAHTVRLMARNSGPSSYTIPAADLETTLTVWIVPA